MKSFTDYLNEKMNSHDDCDELVEGCGCDGTNEDVSSKDAGRIGAAISNRKDLPASEKNVARRSLQRKVARAQRREKAFNVNADSGSRYRVGTKRPTDDTDPKHKGLRRNDAIAKTLKSYGTNEDVEQVDELSAKALKKYRVKSIKDREDTVRQGYNPNTGQLDPEAEKRRKKRLAGFSRAKRKLVAAEEVEQVDEISSDTLRSYVAKRRKQTVKNLSRTDGGHSDSKLKKSNRGVRHALSRLDARDPKGYFYGDKALAREEVEQVDELDTKTVKSYIKKAQKDNTGRVTRMADKPSHMKADKGEMRKLRKRQRGIVKAKTDVDMRNIAGKDYRSRMGEDVQEACWDSHVQRGTKMKGGKVVPNCVPKTESVEEEKKKIKVKLDPKKKIGYEVRSVGPGGKTTVTKRRDMPDKEDVGEGIKDRVSRYIKSFGPEDKMDKKDRILAQQARTQKGSKSRVAGTGILRNVKAAKLKKQRGETNEASGAWQRKEGKNKEGGLNAAGRASYERENPGSDLKAPVSADQAKKSKGGKAAKRRKSFCARMGGMKGAMKDEKGRPTRKALALRKWDC